VLEFRILGPLEVLVDGAPAALGGAKQRALLALLLLEGGRVVSTDRLLETLWSGEPTAAASLQNFVSQLRKALGSDAIETRAPGYRVRLDGSSTKPASPIPRGAPACSATRSATGAASRSPSSPTRRSRARRSHACESSG
jgi:DNA-binding winged helix-turn-helix (wHTH) protein